MGYKVVGELVMLEEGVMTTDSSWSVGKHYVMDWQRHDTEAGSWHTGLIALPAGIVMVYTQSDFSTLRIVLSGRCYQRQFQREISRRTAIVESKRFLSELIP